jgi:NAD(P)-dependent dehydrogenase (short-subunit alcohol dehydrogenase family)
MARVQDKVAVVTGAATGLGFAGAQRLAEEGARVVITDWDEDRGPAAAEQIGHGCQYLYQNVAEEDGWKRVIDKVLERHGRLDVLVNNAGVGIPKNVEETTLKEWRWLMEINLDGVFLGTRYGISTMKDSGGGSIINLSSIEGLIGDRRLAAYDASKAGVIGLTRSAALYAARNKLGVRVNTINPGFIWTELVEGFVKSQAEPEEAQRQIEQAHAVGHMGEPADIAHGVVYLASDESKFVTGTQLVIDGGYTTQ